MDLKDIILKVLKDYGEMQTNLASESARNQIARSIVEKSNKLSSDK